MPGTRIIQYDSSGIMELGAILRGLKKRKRNLAATLAQRGAIVMRDTIKAQYPPPKQGQWLARSSLPNEEGTGRLKANIVKHAKPVIVNDRQAYQMVYIRGARNNMVAYVHEYGMVITAKTDRGMRFFSIPHGHYIRRMKVVIRPKQAWLAGFNKSQKLVAVELRGMMNDRKLKDYLFSTSRI